MAVKGADCHRVTHIALDRNNTWELPFHSIELELAPPCDDHRVVERHELRCQLKSDAGCPARNENGVARELHCRGRSRGFREV